ncbi:hypothetical protein [Botrimarina hoheduenensis]|uniref:Uncharacterized protein n=1 Tax=Botrimarina hoheduenensis TaxID=2528000 RepID=A0A5C5VZ59_9BACT|nr:hypothetical protein [Botrimarina hoheduenensis]TWT43367.1 hypothetical protein Pla111_23180 [Botrimarina hoheduenensis]
MWCCHCQQEVPALGPLRAVGARCPRCERLLTTTSGRPADTRPTPPPVAAPSARDAIDHSLRLAKARIGSGEPARTLRFDLAQHGVSPELTVALGVSGTSTPTTAVTSSAAHDLRGQRAPGKYPVARRSASRRASGTGQFTAWTLSALGALTLGTGIGLLAWSLWGGQPHLWNIALAATLSGQGLLILGLLQLIAVLWAAGRGAAARLGQMHDELRALRRSADAAAGRHTATASQFYADLTQGAGPEVLMGSLRSQLDALSSRLGKR